MKLNNQQLHDLAIAKQLYLERVKVGLNARAQIEFRRYVERLLKQISGRLARSDFTKMSQGALRALLRDLREILAKAAPELRNWLIKAFREFASAELQLASDVWSEGAEPPTEEDDDAAWLVIWSRPFGSDGESLAIMTERFFGAVAVAVTAAVKGAVALKQPTDEVIARIENGINAKHVALTTIVLTSLQRTQAVIFDRVKSPPQYIWISVIDSSTSSICLGLSGRVFRRGRGPLPPAHPRCRSTTAPFYAGRGAVRSDITLVDWLKGQKAQGRNIQDMMSNDALSVSDYVKKVKAYHEAQTNQG